MKIESQNQGLCCLVEADTGVHQFGGVAPYSGIIPARSKTSLQLLAWLDLEDPLVPFQANGLRRIPFYYPFAFGSGDSQVQYEVCSDDSVEILWISDATPPKHSDIHLYVHEIPEARFNLKQLSYEEARAVAFSEACYPFSLQKDDMDVLGNTEQFNDAYVEVGGGRRNIALEHKIACRNPRCKFHRELGTIKVFMKVPPVPIHGSSAWWRMYEGNDVNFCMGLCYLCGTIITFNIAG